MDEVTFLATWDDTGSFGCIHLTKAELEDFITTVDSHNGKHVTSMLINTVVISVRTSDCQKVGR